MPTTERTPTIAMSVRRVRRTRTRVQGVSPPAGGLGAEPPFHETTRKHKSQTRHRRTSQARPKDAPAGAGGVSPCRGVGGRAPIPRNHPPNTKAKPATVVPVRRVQRTRTRVQGVSPPAGGLGAEPPIHLPHPCFRKASDSKARSAGFTPGIDAARRSVSGRTRRSFSRASKRKPRTTS